MTALRRFSSLLLSRFVEEKPIEKLRRLSRELPETWGVPWDFAGVQEKPSNLRYLPDRLFIENKVNAGGLLTSLYKQFEQVLQAFAASDLDSVSDRIDPRLKAKLEAMLSSLTASGRKVQARQDSAGFPDNKPTVNFVDGLIVRGLSTDRDKNAFLSKYHVFTDSLVGVTCFTHLDIQSPYAYVDQVRLEELFKTNRQSLLQLLLYIKSPWKLDVYEGEQEVSKYSEQYSWGQEWTFECMLEQPAWMTDENKTESYLEWIAKFNLGAFKVAEINEVLDGNPLVTMS
jgi:hypothetical protein